MSSWTRLGSRLRGSFNAGEWSISIVCLGQKRFQRHARLIYGPVLIMTNGARFTFVLDFLLSFQLLLWFFKSRGSIDYHLCISIVAVHQDFLLLLFFSHLLRQLVENLHLLLRRHILHLLQLLLLHIRFLLFQSSDLLGAHHRKWARLRAGLFCLRNISRLVDLLQFLDLVRDLETPRGIVSHGYVRSPAARAFLKNTPLGTATLGRLFICQTSGLAPSNGFLRGLLRSCSRKSTWSQICIWWALVMMIHFR